MMLIAGWVGVLVDSVVVQVGYCLMSKCFQAAFRSLPRNPQTHRLIFFLMSILMSDRWFLVRLFRLCLCPHWFGLQILRLGCLEPLIRGHFIFFIHHLTQLFGLDRWDDVRQIPRDSLLFLMHCVIQLLDAKQRVGYRLESWRFLPLQSFEFPSPLLVIGSVAYFLSVLRFLSVVGFPAYFIFRPHLFYSEN